MKKWIADNPWQFAIISNLLSAIIGAALSITLDLVKFFPSQYDQMMREVTQAHLNVQREKQELDQNKAKFLGIISDNIARLPRYQEIEILNEPWKNMEKDLGTLREAAQKREHMDAAIGTAFSMLQSEAAKQSNLLVKLNTDLRADFQRQSELDRSEIKKLREEIQVMYDRNQKIRAKLDSKLSEIGERKRLAESYAGFAGEVGGLYIGTFKDESLFGRIGNVFKLPFQMVGDVAKFNIAESKTKEEKARELAARMQALRLTEEKINMLYANNDN